jgi:hypothetical protein
VGRAEGADIVQLGTDDAGAPVRWAFRDRTQDSFTWRAERSPDGGVSWILLVEFLAHRVISGSVRTPPSVSRPP